MTKYQVRNRILVGLSTYFVYKSAKYVLTGLDNIHHIPSGKGFNLRDVFMNGWEAA